MRNSFLRDYNLLNDDDSVGVVVDNDLIGIVCGVLHRRRRGKEDLSHVEAEINIWTSSDCVYDQVEDCVVRVVHDSCAFVRILDCVRVVDIVHRGTIHDGDRDIVEVDRLDDKVIGAVACCLRKVKVLLIDRYLVVA